MTTLRAIRPFTSRRHLRGWAVPIFVWTGFVALLWFTLICLNTIIRVQWTEREKLAYPIIQLPLQMAQGRKSFYKNGTMWIGFSVAGFIELLAGLSHLFPQVLLSNSTTTQSRIFSRTNRGTLSDGCRYLPILLS